MKICHIDNCVNNWLFIFVHFQPEKETSQDPQELILMKKLDLISCFSILCCRHHLMGVFLFHCCFFSSLKKN